MNGIAIKKLLSQGLCVKHIAEEYGVSEWTVVKEMERMKWENITPPGQVLPTASLAISLSSPVIHFSV